MCRGNIITAKYTDIEWPAGNSPADDGAQAAAPCPAGGQGGAAGRYIEAGDGSVALLLPDGTYRLIEAAP